jgi:Alkylmercury lyase
MPEASADSRRTLSALIGLHRAFPLESRLKKQACDSSRETYLAVLRRWVQTGVAPLRTGFDQEAIDELIALDALDSFGEQLSCPPFSAAPTGIAVHFPHATVHAASAIDALALPRLVDAGGQVDAHCSASGETLTFTLTAAGSAPKEDMGKAAVAMVKVSATVMRYGVDLAPGIRFVKPEIGAGRPQTLTLAEALAVANAFYAFQRAMLRE